MSEVVQQGLIIINQEFKGKEDAIRSLISRALVCGKLNDDNKFYQAVLQREEEVSTAIGYSIAIPHGKSESVLEPFVAFARNVCEFQWGEEDDSKVRLIFMIGVPNESSQLHLKFISQLSKKLLYEEFREKLLMLDSIEEILYQLKTIKL